MKELAIPKNHNQRMYKFGYDTARKETLKEVEKMMDLYSYCAVCGNNLINGECISHIEAVSLINYDELKQEINKLKEDLKKWKYPNQKQ